VVTPFYDDGFIDAGCLSEGDLPKLWDQSTFAISIKTDKLLAIDDIRLRWTLALRLDAKVESG